MPEEWTGELVGKMHNKKVTLQDLATELGCTKSYVSMILNCGRRPAGCRERLEKAFDAVVASRAAEE